MWGIGNRDGQCHWACGCGFCGFRIFHFRPHSPSPLPSSALQGEQGWYTGIKVLYWVTHSILDLVCHGNIIFICQFWNTVMRWKYVDCTPLNSLSKPPFRKHQTSHIEASLIWIYIRKEMIILRVSVTKVKTFPSYYQASSIWGPTISVQCNIKNSLNILILTLLSNELIDSNWFLEKRFWH